MVNESSTFEVGLAHLVSQWDLLVGSSHSKQQARPQALIMGMDLSLLLRFPLLLSLLLALLPGLCQSGDDATDGWFGRLGRRVASRGAGDAALLGEWRRRVEAVANELFPSADRGGTIRDHPHPVEEDGVRLLYKHFPYPPRGHWGTARHRPKAECEPHVIADEIYGSTELPSPFRILVAGGGTGDPAISCGRSFLMQGIPFEIIHLDLSAASNAIARRRIAESRVPNVTVVRARDQMQPGPATLYIVCEWGIVCCVCVCGKGIDF